MDTEKFYRIKLSYKTYDEQGGIITAKEEHLAMAVNYSDAEAVAIALLDEVEIYNDEFNYEIIKTKIEDLAFNASFSVDSHLIKKLIPYYFSQGEDTEAGLYAVSVQYSDENEQTGKVKTSTGTIYVPAETSNDAIANTVTFLHQVGEERDFVIRNVKYDKAQSVLVTADKHAYNTSELL